MLEKPSWTFTLSSSILGFKNEVHLAEVTSLSPTTGHRKKRPVKTTSGAPTITQHWTSFRRDTWTLVLAIHFLQYSGKVQVIRELSPFYYGYIWLLKSLKDHFPRCEHWVTWDVGSWDKRDLTRTRSHSVGCCHFMSTSELSHGWNKRHKWKVSPKGRHTIYTEKHAEISLPNLSLTVLQQTQQAPASW